MEEETPSASCWQPRCLRKPFRPVVLRPCLSAGVPLSYEPGSLHGACNLSIDVASLGLHFVKLMAPGGGERVGMRLWIGGKAV